MKLKATRRGEWPTGLHWTEGEVRTVTIPEGADVPAWLELAKAPKKAKKAKAAPVEG
jgi:hypothetical protein